MDPTIRVLVAKPGLDGHNPGAKCIARALRDAGMEMICAGLRQTPETIANAAQQEIQEIRLSHLLGAHNLIVFRVMGLLKEKETDDRQVVVGGIIPDDDAANLKKMGVAAVFQPDAALEKIVPLGKSAVRASRELCRGAETTPSNILLGFCYIKCKTD